MKPTGTSGSTTVANRKTKRSAYQRTLDMEHNDVLQRIQQKKTEVENMRERVKNARITVVNYEARGLANLEPREMDNLLNTRDVITHLEASIQHATDQANEINYLVATGDILFKYYNVVENGSLPSTTRKKTSIGRGSGKSASGKSSKTSSREAPPSSSQNRSSNDILKYFGRSSSPQKSADEEGKQDDTEKKEDDADEATGNNDMTRHKPSDHDQAGGNVGASKNAILYDLLYEEEEEEEEDRASLLDKYMSYIDSNYMKNPTKYANEDANRCPHCHSTKRVTMLHDGCVYCSECFTQEYILIDHEKPSYKDPPKEIIYYAYKRINHFNEWLNQIQGKETTEIPEEVYDKILLEIKKEKISNMAILRKEKVKSILKKLQINKYYEHVPHIIYRLNGLPVPHMPPSLEERLRHMFSQIQVPFLKYAPPERKNFLSYAYVLHKFMQLLEKDQYLPSFPLLKSREKLHNQDLIWQKICMELGWEFYKSI
jgi:hypothetical protein